MDFIFLRMRLLASPFGLAINGGFQSHVNVDDTHCSTNCGCRNMSSEWKGNGDDFSLGLWLQHFCKS
jgi:hypothetical protein